MSVKAGDSNYTARMSDKYFLRKNYYLLGGSRQIGIGRVQLSKAQEVSIKIDVIVAHVNLPVAQSIHSQSGQKCRHSLVKLDERDLCIIIVTRGYQIDAEAQLGSFVAYQVIINDSF